MNERLCPQCCNELTQVGKFWICPEHGQVSLDKPVLQMRIFLSYGHDSNEELVCRIKAYLEKRGHDVWFDKTEIKSGHDWRRSITEGIVDSNRVLFFLSKHSTCDPGICLDEIAIAIGVKGGNIQTILVENETEVKPPPSISHIQWLDMHDWEEKLAAGDAVWEKWYQEKLGEIVSVVESDDSRRFAGEIRTLEEHLRPISSDSRIFQLLKKGLVGRVWLVEAIEKWRNAADRTSRLFWIIGAPGVGKSAFVAHLAHYGKDKVIAVQLCEYDKPDHRNAHRIVRTIAFQIATRLPDYRKFLLKLHEITDLDQKNPDELFDYLLAEPLRHSIDGGRERYLIVIDALDEAVEAGRNPLVEMLARNAKRLPDWIGIIVTSRPESNVIAPLQGLNPFVLDTATESNRADIRDYLRRELASLLQNRPDTDDLLEQILIKSEGVFLYVERFCYDVQHGYLSLDLPKQFPQGLGGIFFQYFQRQFPDLEKFRKDMRSALRAIIAAREPLPLEIIQRLFNWQDEELRDFTRPLGSLFPVTTASGLEVIKPYHKSLADWLADETKAGTYFVSLQEGHRMLAEYGWGEYQQKPHSSNIRAQILPHIQHAAHDYVVRWSAFHAFDAGLIDLATTMLSDSSYLRENVSKHIEVKALGFWLKLTFRLTLESDMIMPNLSTSAIYLVEQNTELNGAYLPAASLKGALQFAFRNLQKDKDFPDWQNVDNMTFGSSECAGCCIIKDGHFSSSAKNYKHVFVKPPSYLHDLVDAQLYTENANRAKSDFFFEIDLQINKFQQFRAPLAILKSLPYLNRLGRKTKSGFRSVSASIVHSEFVYKKPEERHDLWLTNHK